MLRMTLSALLVLASLAASSRGVPADANAGSLPAARLSYENPSEARERSSPVRPSQENPAPPNSAWDRQLPFSIASWNQIPVIQNPAMIGEMFERIRDARNWRWNGMPQFARRLFWLYPDDGCYLRAELMNEQFEKWKYPIPANVFVFGELSYRPPYPVGSEEFFWWYHVAPAFRVGDHVFVIDPSVDTSEPLSLERWIRRFAARPEEVSIAICGPGSVSPDDECDQPLSMRDREVQDSTLQQYLEMEWTHLEMILGTSPSAPLGEYPPWR